MLGPRTIVVYITGIEIGYLLLSGREVACFPLVSGSVTHVWGLH